VALLPSHLFFIFFFPTRAQKTKKKPKTHKEKPPHQKQGQDKRNRIICCQIFCDLLLKSAFEQIFNVMQLILVKIK
jgi:hypothetical protein